MDKPYADTVRLLLTVAPDVFRNPVFAMKGGTAINLFVRDMPRLSVDIDVVFVPWAMPRDEALRAIGAQIEEIRGRMAGRGLEARTIRAQEFGGSTLLISDGSSQVKVEVNQVFRGTVMPVETRPLAPRTVDAFSAELELPTLAVDELYGSKLVAACDRQHPRDLFDVAELYAAGGITAGMVECFVSYLAGHNRPVHEVLFARPKDIAREYETTFVGMTREPVGLGVLESTRDKLFRELPALLSDRHKRFLCGLVRAEPDWTLLDCAYAAELPALQWKLRNLQKFRSQNPSGFQAQADELEARFG